MRSREPEDSFILANNFEPAGTCHPVLSIDVFCIEGHQGNG